MKAKHKCGQKIQKFLVEAALGLGTRFQNFDGKAPYVGKEQANMLYQHFNLSSSAFKWKL